MTLEDRLFELQEALAAALATGEPIDRQAWAERFDVDASDVDACLRAAKVLASDLGAPEAVRPALPEDYEYRGELGRGGMGVVYRAFQRSLGREVALKVVRDDHLDRAAQRFQREAQSLARLRHPNVVAVHEVGRTGDHLYYTMDLIEGRDLAQVLGSGPLSPTQAVDLMLQVTDAVAHAHRQGVLHRDLKPANVLLGEDGQAYVVDFGIARQLLGQRTRHTVTGELLGTPAAMSPEQARGDHEVIGERTDVYGLGVVLYWMLTGQPPFDGESIPDLLRDVVDVEPARADRVRRSVPRDLATICAVAMAKSPDDRYGNANALAEDLKRFAGGDPIQAKTAGAARRAWRVVRRQRRTLITAAAILAFVVTIVALFVLPDVRRSDRLAVAKDLRDRGQSEAAMTVLGELREGGSDAVANRAFVEAQLDLAEAKRRRGEDPSDLLRMAGAEIGKHYEVGPFGARTGPISRQQRAAAERMFSRREDPSWPGALEDGVSPWAVLQLRHTTLVGDLESLGHAWNQLGMTGPPEDEIIDWLADARQRADHPAHDSAIGMLALQCLPHNYGCVPSLEFDAVAIQPLRELARVPHHPALLDFIRTAIGTRLRRSAWAPGAGAIPALAQDLEAQPPFERAVVTAHLLLEALGAPVVELGEEDFEAWRSRLLEVARAFSAEGGDEREAARLKLGFELWRAMPESQAAAQWFEDLTGQRLAVEDAAAWLRREHWSEPARRRVLLGIAPDEDLLEVLGGAVQDGVELRRVHQLMQLGRSVGPAWVAGGVAYDDGEETVGRRRQIELWTRFLGVDSSRRFRVRLAAAVMEDGSARPRIVARRQMLAAVGDPIHLDSSEPRVLPYSWVTPMVREQASDTFGRTLTHDAAVQFSIHGELASGRGGALLRIQNESTLRPASVRRVREDREYQLSVATGEVTALGLYNVEWPFSGWRRADVLLLISVESEDDPAVEWSFDRWRRGLGDWLAATDGELSDGAIEIASHVPMPESLQRLRGEFDRREQGHIYRTTHLARARLLAGDDAPELDEEAVRDYVGRRRWTPAAAFCARWLEVRPDHAARVAATLGTLSGMDEVTAGVADRLRALLQGRADVVAAAPQASVGHWLFGGVPFGLMGTISFVGWALAFVVFLRTPVRPNDRLAARTGSMLIVSGILLQWPLVLQGSWVLLPDWVVLATLALAYRFKLRQASTRLRALSRWLGVLAAALLIVRWSFGPELLQGAGPLIAMPCMLLAIFAMIGQSQRRERSSRRTVRRRSAP